MYNVERVNCTICNSDNAQQLLVKNSFNIVQCKACGLIYVNPRPTERELANFYMSRSKQHTLMDTLLKKKDYEQKFKQRLKTIERFFDMPGKMLDVGCSTGQFLNIARDSGWEVCGNDVDENKIAYARNTYGLQVYSQKLREIGFPNESFEVITLFDSIEHLTDPLSILEEISRILKEDGVLVITTPNSDGLLPRLTYFLFAKTIGAWEHPTPPGHLCQFSRDTITKLLQRADFHVVDIVSEHIPLRYTVEKFVNSVIVAIKEKIGRKLLIKEDKRREWGGKKEGRREKLSRAQFLKAVSRVSLSCISWVIVVFISIFAHILRRGDSMMVVAKRRVKRA